MTSKGMPASGSRTQKVTIINAIKHAGLDPRMGKIAIQEYLEKPIKSAF